MYYPFEIVLHWKKLKDNGVGRSKKILEIGWNMWMPLLLLLLFWGQKYVSQVLKDVCKLSKMVFSSHSKVIPRAFMALRLSKFFAPRTLHHIIEFLNLIITRKSESQRLLTFFSLCQRRCTKVANLVPSSVTFSKKIILKKSLWIA